MSSQREFLHPTFVRKPADAAGTAGLDYPSALVGATGNITIYYATSLGDPGLELANAMLGVVTGPYNDMETFFGIAGGPVTVVIAPLSGNNEGGGGAYHYGCDFSVGGTIYLDATFALPNSVDVELALYVAELSECFMGAQGLGWSCGSSNGEGLSRFCAEVDTPPGSFPAWGITGPSWVSAGYPDWVNNTDPTDRHYDSTGCAVLYIYWMLSLGYTKEQVIQAGGATLAENYQTLTGKTTAYADLTAAVQAVTVTSDNPFYPMSWRPMTNTSGFGNLNDGQHLFWVGDFGGTGHSQVLIYSAPDGNWWLGDFAGGGWQEITNTSGFGKLNDGQHRFWIGDLAGAGHAQVLFYDANDSNWWLGAIAS